MNMVELILDSIRFGTLGSILRSSNLRHKEVKPDRKSKLATLQPALDALATLPGIACLQGLPSRNRSGFNTNHVLVRIIRSKVGHTLGLLDPRVPDYNIGQRLPCDREQSLIIGGGNLDRLLRVKILINAINLFCDGQGIRGLGVSGCVADFVHIGFGLEVLNSNVGDVLLKSDAANARRIKVVIPQPASRCASGPGSRSSACPHS